MPVYKCRTLISTPRDLLRIAGRVPRLSPVYSRVKLLLNRRELPCRRIAREILGDAAIAARLPRIARVMYPALEQGPGGLPDLLALLDAARIKDLVLVTAIAAAYRNLELPDYGMRRYWRLATRRALLARLIALETPHVEPTRAFVAGLVADVGHLLLQMAIPAQAEDARNRAAQSGLPLAEVEAALLGFDYAQAGAVLVRRWRHCHLVEAAVENHTRPLMATEARADACVLHVASQLAEVVEAGADVAHWQAPIRAAVWSLLGSTSERLALMVAGAGEQFTELLDALAPERRLDAASAPAPVARLPLRAPVTSTAQAPLARKAG